MSSVRKTLISAFVILNVSTVLYMNRPVVVDAKIKENFPARLNWGIEYGGWLIARYAHVVGLDNRWQMFGQQSRFQWWYVIKANYENDKERVLPLAMQSERTFWEDFLFDFKEAKLYLNLYTRPDFRETYARYLSRQFATFEGAPVTSIVYELHWRNILNPQEAARRGFHLEERSYKQLLQEVECR